ncbi:L,D-transpeptidase family protein [Oligoflexaceae bacterium]|nr:L,D-transpeptidase family protein [Oligoflexaceae bacterium]
MKGAEADEVSAPSLTPMVQLIVDKEKLTAELKGLTEVGAASETWVKFKIAIGKEQGDKEKEGDNKTPEGIYFTRRPIAGKNLPAKYGSYALPINFPNPLDRVDGRTGHGIWLHGVEKNSRIEEANVTEGCVAFYNEDIAAVRSWLSPLNSVIVIAEQSSKVNDEDERKQVESRTESWLKAWQSKNVEDYISHYHKEFKHRKGQLKEFAAYKSLVFSGYKKMDVSMDQIRVVTHPKYAVSIMNQKFNGDDRYVSNGRKVLYWKKNEDGKWMIIRENFRAKPFQSEAKSQQDFTDLRAALYRPKKIGEKLEGTN